MLATLAVAACGTSGPIHPSGASAASAPPRLSETSPSTPARPAAPLPFEAASSPGDVVAPFVRPERSSRLATSLPRGKARQRWTLALDPKLDPAFVVTAGSRIVVQGKASTDKEHAGFVDAPFVLLDTDGTKIAAGDLGGALVRLAPDAGKLYAIGGSGVPTAWQLSDGARIPDKLSGTDDPRSAQGSLAARAASHDGTFVFVQASGVEIDGRRSGQQRTVVEPPVQPLDAAIDEEGNLHVIVRQTADLALWTTPLAGGSVGRVRIGPLRRDHADVPPILGRSMRVIVLDDRMVAIARDGKTLWERKGALTGGASITADDHLLVATDTKVMGVDSAGKASEITSAPKEIFLTPPILTASGLLLVASGRMLHAYTFE